MTTTYSPKTLLRLYNDDKTAHVTGVILKDGIRLFEITSKQTYDSVDVWKAGSTMKGEMTVDTSKEERIVIPSDKIGFINVSQSVPHTYWIYMMLQQYTPHLLEREDIKIAFNNYHTIYADKIARGDITIYYSDYHNYMFNNLAEPETFGCNVPYGYLTHYLDDYPRKQLSVVEEIVNAYTPVYNLIKTDLLPHIAARNTAYQKKWDDNNNKRLVKVYMRRIEKYKKLITMNEELIIIATPTTYE